MKRPHGGPSPQTAAVPPAVAGTLRLPVDARVERLDDGLTVCLLSNRSAPVVTTALWYRAGTRHEAPGHGGTAHFLEHMMFKGSPRYGPGEIDRLTQSLGGVNNAFTSHDATAYYFKLAPEFWRRALDIEADRMAALTLDPVQVEAERRVILEEIAMYEASPWDSLDERVQAARFPGHPYGRPVLGSAEDLLRTGAAELADFHRRHYRPADAVLVIAGDVGGEAVEAAAEAFAEVPAREAEAVPPSAEPPPSEPPAPSAPSGPVRVEQRRGEVARLIVALPCPPSGHPDHAALRLASVLLGSGRASRLHRRLVDDEELCTGVSADVSETVDAGSFAVSAELIPGAEPAAVEERVMEELGALAGERPPTPRELARVRRMVSSDWVFAHEKVHNQALTAGFALTLFGDLHHAERELEGTLAASSDSVVVAAGRWLDPERAVVGWSLPRTDSEGAPATVPGAGP